MRYNSSISILTFVLLLGIATASQAQDQTCIVYADEISSETATFTAFLNTPSQVLTEQAAGSSIQTGSVVVPVGNFSGLSADDSLYVRIVDNAGNRTGTALLANPTASYCSGRAVLESAVLPPVPLNVQVGSQDTATRIVTWDSLDGLSYDIYRRALEDTLDGGDARGVFQLVAENVTGDRFVDDEGSPDSTYAYTIYSRNGQGVYSSHSSEVSETARITGLSALAKTATTVTLGWDQYDVPFANTVGYNIYRRAEGEPFGNVPVGFTGTMDARDGTIYTDTRLIPGNTYYYKVTARYDNITDEDRYEEYGATEIIGAELTADTTNYYSYANLKVAVVVFRYTNCRDRLNCSTYRISDQEYRDLKFMLEKARRFYWQNSDMQLNLQYTYYPVSDFVDFGDGGSYSSANQTGRYLRDHYGVTKTQYDMVYMLNAATGGNHSFGTIGSDLELPGPDRGPSGAVAYSHHYVPKGHGFFRNGVYFPDKAEGTDHIWTFTHEAQHAIDAIYKDNAEPQMGHGDHPELYGNPEIKTNNFGTSTGEPPGYKDYPTNYPPDYPEGYGFRFGKRFDFQSALVGEFNAFKNLTGSWGDIYEAPDQDGDGFPDADSLVAFDELRFGSSVSSTDTDSDGASDRKEALGGLYYYSQSDPTDRDTDRDGISDGDDPFPRYSVRPQISKADAFTPIIDGAVGEWPESTLISDSIYVATKGESFAPRLYMSYTSDSLYIALDMANVAIPELTFDFGADGRWYGAGNTKITFDIADEQLGHIRSWDARDDVQRYLIEEKGRGSGDGMWDDTNEYQTQFNRRVFAPHNLDLAINRTGSRVEIELALARNEEAGLELFGGETIGIYLNYSNVNLAGAKAAMVDPWSYVYLTMESGGVSTQPPTAPRTVRLGPNYPNPFDQQTKITYAVDRPGKVSVIVFDVLGRRIATLTDSRKTAGTYTVMWDGRTATGKKAASGIYFYRLNAPGDRRLIKKMMLVR